MQASLADRPSKTFELGTNGDCLAVLLRTPAAAQRIEILERYYPPPSKFRLNFSDFIASHGTLETLKWLLSKGHELVDQDIYTMALEGHTDMLAYLIAQGQVLPEDVASIVLVSGHCKLHVLEFLSSQGYWPSRQSLRSYRYACMLFPEFENKEVTPWLHKHYWFPGWF